MRKNYVVEKIFRKAAIFYDEHSTGRDYGYICGGALINKETVLTGDKC